MGFQATVMVYVDALQLIEDDANFGRRLAEAIRERGTRAAGDPVRVSSHMSDAAVVVVTHHADATAVVAVGQNSATVMGMLAGPHHTPEGRLTLLRMLADDMGYTLAPKVAKPPRDPAAAKRRQLKMDAKTRRDKGGS